MGDIVLNHGHWQNKIPLAFSPQPGWPHFGFSEIPRVMFMVGSYEEAAHRQIRHPKTKLAIVRE